MSSLPFTLRQLDVFLSVCATGSFRQSAEDLRISQASVSGQVKALERQLGVALLLRRPGRRAQLTPAGTAFLEDMTGFRQAAARLASHRRLRSALARPPVYRIRIGEALLQRFVRPRLGEFLARMPDVEMEFEAQPPGSHPVQEVLGGRFDFGLFHVRVSEPLPAHIRSIAVTRGGVYGHRKFAEGKALPLSAAEISRLPFVLPKAGSRLEKASLAALAGAGIKPRQVVGHSPFFDVQVTLLANGMGVASFSDPLVPADLRDTIVLLHPTEDWRLVFFRKDDASGEHADAVEQFLISSVLESGDYTVTD
ncbi:conserved hypothetical protein [Altererythrobacter sp. B11]|uniref:LysR family transcriptional regulator n=1 Tax=Altererythrobacter sp. B11 TaxID=2060312 RepID=UPI000DC74046|nr:LysR family transcriptional regulator [Altererythrobacter sp. B11]BBC74259.1 conserved hypothetical protein [Altererythrobacter sp. B11]